ncbi:hypothetical protein [Sphingomonas sp. Marseille-Q8236]
MTAPPSPGKRKIGTTWRTPAFSKTSGGGRMEPIFYVMAILGCGDGSIDCTEARMVPARYETMAQCRADLANRIATNTDVPFPVIGADCRRMGAQMAKAERKPSRG